MATIREEATKEGYNREEEYFYRQNRELIDRRRSQLDEQRRAQKAEQQAAEHWMRCPKCGGRMETTNLMQIYVEQCSSCQGVYLDHGELETLLHSQEPKSFFESLRRIFTTTREHSPKLF